METRKRQAQGSSDCHHDAGAKGHRPTPAVVAPESDRAQDKRQANDDQKNPYRAKVGYGQTIQ